MNGVLGILIMRLVQRGRVLLEDEMREALFRWEQGCIYNRSWVLYSELSATWNRSRSEKLLIVIPYSGGASLAVTVLFLDISGVRCTKQFKEVQLKLPWIKFSKDQVDIISALSVLLLEHDHAIEELHVGAPSRDGL